MSLWGLNPRLWLSAYLQACAEAGGRAPELPERFLPWSLSEQQKQEWSLKPAPSDSS